jgi:hypothetical protein
MFLRDKYRYDSQIWECSKTIVSPDFSHQREFQIALHSPYSEDTLRLYFWLLDDLKKQIQNMETESFAAVNEVLKKFRGILADIYCEAL